MYTVLCTNISKSVDLTSITGAVKHKRSFIFAEFIILALPSSSNMVLFTAPLCCLFILGVMCLTTASSPSGYDGKIVQQAVVAAKLYNKPMGCSASYYSAEGWAYRTSMQPGMPRFSGGETTSHPNIDTFG